MGEKRADTPAVTPRSDSAPRSGQISIDINHHLAQRKAVGALLDREKKVFVARRTFHRGSMTARILVDGKYYDVNQSQLAAIQEGRRPEDLWGVEEVPTCDYGDDEH